jgi:hypothetical protein
VEFDLAQPNFINSKTLRIKIKRRYAGICMGFGKKWPFQIDSFPLKATIPFRPSPFPPPTFKKILQNSIRCSAWPQNCSGKPMRVLSPAVDRWSGGKKHLPITKLRRTLS